MTKIEIYTTGLCGYCHAAKELLKLAQQDVNEKWQLYSGMANLDYSKSGKE